MTHMSYVGVILYSWPSHGGKELTHIHNEHLQKGRKERTRPCHMANHAGENVSGWWRLQIK